jgi:hypothetical protein
MTGGGESKRARGGDWGRSIGNGTEGCDWGSEKGYGKGHEGMGRRLWGKYQEEGERRG